MKSGFYIFLLFFLLFSSCSTENNAFLNRTYHSTTARFNGYFNANELLDQALRTFYSANKDDFYSILDVNPLPDEEEAKAMYSAIDTAVVKCSEVIKNHSMPSTEDMYYKDVEHNRWIDENWITIGKALYYKRAYEKALKNFQFVKRLFAKDPSFYVAKLWIAKIHIEQKSYADAKLTLDDLNAISQEQRQKTFKDYIPFVNKKPAGEDIVPEISRDLQYDIYKSYADLAIKRKEYPEAIQGLKSAIVKCPTAKEKTRLNFILGQLYQRNNQLDSAAYHFSNALKSAAPYEIAFNARLSRAICGGGERLSKDLKRMLKDAKNAQYKDQIYYAMANLELNRNEKELGISYLTACAFYSNGNARQKAMAYEKLGDISYGDRDYVSAQKYYDSCARFIPEGYPNAEFVREKAVKLSDLVVAIETVNYEDSVERIALMPEKERERFLKETLKQLKREAQERKEREAAKLLALQEQSNANSNANASKSVFSNPKLREEGFEEFRKIWGTTRENEDHWRRSEKMSFELSETPDSLNSDSLLVEDSDSDSLSVDDLRKNLPLTDSLFAVSELRLFEALYLSGVLYKEILNETALAQQQFERVLEKNKRNLTDLSSAFQLYKINEASGNNAPYVAHILEYYPGSDVAKYLKDPDFYIKQKESEKINEQEYITMAQRYFDGNYQEVADASLKIIEEDVANAFRAEYLLLHVFAMGQITEDKSSLEPLIQKVIDEKPGTPQADIAEDLLKILKDGFSENESLSFEPDYIYKRAFSEKHYVFILLDKEEDEELEDLKSAVKGFNKKKHKAGGFQVSTSKTAKKEPFVLVKEFTGSREAQSYINTYKGGYEYLEEFQNNAIYSIGKTNLKLLIESSKLTEYKSFFDDFY
ncbi:MAG: hypothetical protein P8M87_00440 [Crocinitomicaceae bacterium]|nr:hypothetical protein [Crocinitomicaceae bacterium]